ncbi:Acyl-CoA dehydrogenase [subsurface metagenome]
MRDFANNEIEPIAAQIDEEERVPLGIVKKMADLGLCGIPFPEEYGGSGGGEIELCIVAEEVSRVCAAIGGILLVSSGVAGIPIYEFGTEEQRKRFVTPIATGEKLAAFALTEASAGSDAAALETTATRKDDGYLLNGTKTFITSGPEADFALVFATLDKSLGYRGITAFIVEKETPGFSVGKIEHKLGMRASSTAELVFEDCFVPEENRLGKEGEGFRIAIGAIDASRLTVAAQAVGIAQVAFEKSLEYAKERVQFGRPIASFQAIQWFLADMATQIDAARLLTYRGAYLQGKGLPFVKEAAMAKVFASEVAMWVTNKAIQIHGGYGYVKDYPLERYFRDAKVTEIYEGTSEMQRLTIARALIGKI